MARAHTVSTGNCAALIGSGYLPIGEKLRIAARNRRIYLDWRGNNYAELMAKYRIGTERRVQQIIAEQATIQQRQIQPDFFDPL